MPLPFPSRTRYSAETFQVSEANSHAHDLVARWPNWPAHAAILFSCAGAGKTHLCHIWAARAAARVFPGAEFSEASAFALDAGFAAAVDDADIAAASDEGARALFHLLNRAQQEGGWVLLTGSTHPSLWRTGLPDLRTRLASAPSVELPVPDDALMAAVLAKAFADRQLRATPQLIASIVARIERNFGAAERLVAAMDAATLGTGKLLTAELAGRLIEADARD